MKARQVLVMAVAVMFVHFSAIAQNADTDPEGNDKAGVAAGNSATSWQVTTIPLRGIGSAPADATIKLALHLPPAGVPVKSVLVYVSTLGHPEIKGANAAFLEKSTNPWQRNARRFNQNGIAVAFADASSDANERPGIARPAELKRDVEQVLHALGAQFPQVPVDVAAYSSSGMTVLNVMKSVDGVRKVMIVSGAFADARTSDWSDLKTPVLLVHAPSADCSVTPFLDAQFVAQKNHFTLVSAGYEQQEISNRCGGSSQSGLRSLDSAFVDLVMKWLDNTPVDNVIGYQTPPLAWREEIVHYRTANNEQLEMTLLLPPGEGPFPVVLFNHGDMTFEQPGIKYKRRFRDMIVAHEFLDKGLAVAFPSRAGIGLSEGMYRMGYASSDGDATYKARSQTQDVLPALDYLRSRKEFDSKRIILSGQSSGGYITMYIASLHPDGVIGAINFSGGRTDLSSNHAASYLNTTMTAAFTQFGQTTSLPVLFIFAENDSRYSANTIRAIYHSFVDAGGHGSLLLTPPIQIDGHFVFHLPELWRAALAQYLDQIGVVAPARPE